MKDQVIAYVTALINVYSKKSLNNSFEKCYNIEFISELNDLIDFINSIDN